MGTIIVALLAITMAILPISVPQAAMAAAHGHATAVDAGHEHAAIDGDQEHTHVLASSADTASVHLGDHDGNSEDCPGPICCSMGTCHAVQVTAPPSVYSPAVSEVSLALTRDEQVEDITVGGLDKPPRTV